MTEQAISDLITTLIEQMIQDDEAGCEATAIRLGEIGDAALPMIQALLASTEVDARFWAIRSLWAHGGDVARQRLIDLLADPEEMIRSGTALALGMLRAATAVPDLLRLLREDTAAPGDHASDALGKIGQPAAKALLEALQSPHALIRLRAAKALTPIESHAAIPALIHCLDHDPSYLVRHYADVALKRMGVGEMIYFL